MALMLRHLLPLPVPLLLAFLLAASSHGAPPGNESYDPSLCLREFSTCGNVRIKYPFYFYNKTADILGNPVSYCGYPGLGIQCEDSRRAFLEIGSEKYNVSDINYTDFTISVVDPDAISGEEMCPGVDHNVTLPQTSWLTYSNETVDYLVFFLNCDFIPGFPRLPNMSSITCQIFGGSMGGLSFVLLRDDVPAGDWPRACKVFEVPILKSLVRQNPYDDEWRDGGYGKALRTGFQLMWEQNNSSCNQCERSKGQCAYNHTMEFVGCLCPGGVVDAHRCSSAMRSSLCRHGGGLLLILCFLATAAVSSRGDDNYTVPVCQWRPYLCGAVNISYPFYLSNASEALGESHCGYPGLAVRCDGGTKAVLRLGLDNYTVSRIEYDSLTVSLADADTTSATCPIASHNVTIPPDLKLYFPISAVDYLVFFIGCAFGGPKPAADEGPKPPKPPQLKPITCGGGSGGSEKGPGANSSFVIPRAVVPPGDWPRACRAVFQVPVLTGAIPRDAQDPAWRSDGYGAALRAGFQVGWERSTGTCGQCEQSNGRCGYSRAGELLGCVCADGRLDRGGSCSKNISVSAPGSKTGIKLIAGVTAGGFSLLLVAGVIAFFVIRKKKQKKGVNSSSKLLKYSGSGGTPYSRGGDTESGSIQDLQTHLFSYEELEEATDRFNDNRELGDGGFGTVYKVHHLVKKLAPLISTRNNCVLGHGRYVDPEYHQCYQLTDKSDVYSFGVVLVELISSKPAVDITRHRNEINLAGMAISKIQKCQLEELVDLELGYESDPATKKMMTMVAELAFRCLQQNGEMRPPIKEVLEVLKAIQGECRLEKDGDKDKDLAGPFSPNTVHATWESRATTPNTSRD
ncbi:hypothetical protein EJB05_17355 [Eragrostis curvula]|uniref:Protein kinase domain-containing protein n=1 Tax=Eragrostis curvula TaxID=38414 RepID=A0A5J9VJ49_9POAL|nr:hypothetical protein EJB05_17355 [Eragrostis curvula]